MNGARVKVHIKAIIDHKNLADMIRAHPSLAEAVPVAAFVCGPFECEAIEDVWALARAFVVQERQASYELLRDFAP